MSKSTLADHISSEQAESIFDNQLKHEQTRKHIMSIVEECTNSVSFMKKVREYAGEEIDSRLFTSFKFYLTAIVAGILSVGGTKLVGYLISTYLTKQ